jgi:polysaccharide pyruvyl transferase WcaK-like protein
VTRRAAYLSVRDQESARQIATLSGAAEPAVFADLAFDLPAPPDTTRLPGRAVVGVMRFGSSDDRVDAYRDKIAWVVRRLLDEGLSVRIVVGALTDVPVAEQICALARAETGCGDDRLALSPAATQREVMVEMARAEVAVASRYHNVIAALRVATPTVSLSYAGKNASVMARFGLAERDQPIDDFDAELVLRQTLEARATESPAPMARALDDVRAALDRQYADVADLLHLRVAPVEASTQL